MAKELSAWSRALRLGFIELTKTINKMKTVPKTKEAVKYWFLDNVLSYIVVFSFLFTVLFFIFGR